MSDITVTIARFKNKAQSKMIDLTAEITGLYDYKDWQQDDVDDKILLRYELSEAITLLSYENNRLTDKEVLTLIDWLSVWAELDKKVLVNFSNYQMPIQGQIVVESGDFALQADLTQESANRSSADSALSARIDDVEAQLLDPAAILPSDFYDNQNTSTVNVWDDDTRLHVHTNKTILDGIDQSDSDNIDALQAHYDSIGGANSQHVTSAERTIWNAKIDQSSIDALATVYAAINHTHEVQDVNGLDAIINQINTDIAAMAGDDGVDGREIELQSPDGDLIQYRYVGDTVWIDIGNFKGDTGEGFVIDARGTATGRLDAIYDAEGSSFAYLAEDTGDLYFRNPSEPTATVPGGWSDPIKFLGNNGWAPVLGLVNVNSEKAVFFVSDWVGGEGDKPVIPEGEVWYLGANGITTSQELAINARGPQGATGGGPVIGGSGTLANRSTFDDESLSFIYLQTDVTPNVIFIKNSDASADWGGPWPWQGETGTGTQGPAGPGTTQTISQTSHGFTVGQVISHDGSDYVLYDGSNEILGLVTEVANTNTFTLQQTGFATTFTGLTPGTYYAQTDGSIGTNITSKKIFVATSTTSGYIISAGNGLLDEDDMASDSETQAPTQQSVKAYVDSFKPRFYPANNTNTITHSADGSLAISFASHDYAIVNLNANITTLTLNNLPLRKDVWLRIVQNASTGYVINNVANLNNPDGQKFDYATGAGQKSLLKIMMIDINSILIKGYANIA